MSFLDYLHGSYVLSGTRPLEPDAIAVEADRAAQAVEADERRAFAPFEAPRVLKSEIPNVSNEAWTNFVLAMKTAQPTAVSASNSLGMFEMKVRRLVDLGLVRNAKRTRSPSGRLMWLGEFVPPLTEREFLNKPSKQYEVFINSTKSYISGLVDGSVNKPDGGFPVGMTLSGALSILHRCGPTGLKGWNDPSDRFSDTVALYEQTNGLF